MESVLDNYLHLIVSLSLLLGVIATGNKIDDELDVGGTSEKPISSGRSFFSPKIDYNNKWTPVGRGDPLKNDPTYDYSPPVLDRVHYWNEINSNKKEILLLGVSSKRPINNLSTGHSPVRRNYYNQLPTVLMPPPMQTLHGNYKRTKVEITKQKLHPMQHLWPPKMATNSDTNGVESMNILSVANPNSVREEYSGKDETYNTGLGSTSKQSWIQALLQKEISRPGMNLSTVYPNQYNGYMETSTHFTPTIPPKIHENPSFLIIQGHSKVKTYGLPEDGQKKQPIIIPVGNVGSPVVTHVVGEDNGKRMEVMHLHSKERQEIEPDRVNSVKAEPKGGLLSLLDSSIGDFLLSNEESQKKIGLNVNEISKNDKIKSRDERQSS